MIDKLRRRKDIMMTQRPLRYSGYGIVFQEVPNEISIVFNITGCPHKCCGCHSKYLWEYNGKILKDDIENIIKKYIGGATCVCFMGGDQSLGELTCLLKLIKKRYKLKTCVYSGSNDINLFKKSSKYIDYLKIGSYIEALGGLDSTTTNQRFYKIKDNIYTDITYLFQKEYK